MGGILATIFIGALEGVSLAVRAFSAAFGILLIARAVAEKMLPVTVETYLRPFIRYTDIFVLPMRRILPESLTVRESDYAPLLSAVILLFTGYGVAATMDVLKALIGG